MTEYALRLESRKDTAPRVRMGDTLGLAGNGPLQARGGLRPDGGGTVTVVAGTMQVTVSPFLAWVDGTASTTQGGYPFVLDADKTLTLADGDAAQDRVDTVVARVRDNAFDAGGITLADVAVLGGAPGGGAPVVPAGWLPLWDVNVPAGASAGNGGLTGANLATDRRQYTAALGGILPVSSQAERDALTATPGQHVWRLDTLTEERWNGTGWEDAGGQQVTPYVEVTGPGQSVSSGSVVTATLNTVVEESLEDLANTAGNAVVIPTGWGGVYEVHFGIDWNAGGGGNRGMVVRRNGADVPRLSDRWAPTGGSGTTAGGHMHRTSGKTRLAAGDVIQLGAWQDGSGSFAFDGAFLQLEWIRP